MAIMDANLRQIRFLSDFVRECVPESVVNVCLRAGEPQRTKEGVLLVELPYILHFVEPCSERRDSQYVWSQFFDPDDTLFSEPQQLTYRNGNSNKSPIDPRDTFTERGLQAAIYCGQQGHTGIFKMRYTPLEGEEVIHRMTPDLARRLPLADEPMSWIT